MIKIFLSLFFLFSLSGCYDLSEPNDIAYIVALGIDETDETGIYEFTVQFAKTKEISGGSSMEGGKSGSEITELITIKAPTAYAALNIANHVVSKRFTLSHAKLFVFSEVIAKKGVRNLSDIIGRNSDIRPNIYLAVSHGKAKDYLDSVKPMVEVNPVSYYRLLFESQYGGFIPKNMTQEFYTRIDSVTHSPVLPLTGVNQINKGQEKDEKKEDKQKKQEENINNKRDTKIKNIHNKGFEFHLPEYIAGQTDVDKENASEVMGMAVFKKDRMVGTMSGIESEIYNILTGQFQNSYTTFYTKESPDNPVTVFMEQSKNPKIKIDLLKENPVISIKVYLDASLVSESATQPIDEKITSFEQQAEESLKIAAEEFLTRTTEEFASDIIGFGDYAKRSFLDYQTFLNYNWEEKYPDSEFTIDMNFNLRRVGFIALEE